MRLSEFWITLRIDTELTQVYSVAINFVTSEDVRILRDMELYYSTQIDEMPMSMFPVPSLPIFLCTS